jgi:hypothetical protein
MTFAMIQKLLVLSICCIYAVAAWSPQLNFSRIAHSSHSDGTRAHSSSTASTVGDESSTFSNSQTHDTRRQFLNAAVVNFCLMGAAAPAAMAADAPLPPGTKYISGKTPLPPGETKKKSDNPKGTRKDPDFLRSVADCRNQCQSVPGPDGLAKSKEDCLSECQDICCKTYEQCTFNIVPRI